MNWISNLLSKNSTQFHFSLIFVACLVLTIFAQGPGKWASQISYTVFHYPFFTLRSSYETLLSVQAENDELRHALVDASVKLSLMDEAARENERFRSVLGFEPPAAYELFPAKIISVEGDVVPTHAVINKGARDSVALYQTVINQLGLVGRIESVTLDFATVQLLTDGANHVAARLAESREMGIVKYSFSSGMVLDNLPVQSKVVVGEKVISSGLGGIYPPGIEIGTVSEVDRPEDEPFCRIQLAPAVEFRTIEELFILRSVTE